VESRVCTVIAGAAGGREWWWRWCWWWWWQSSRNRSLQRRLDTTFGRRGPLMHGELTAGIRHRGTELTGRDGCVPDRAGPSTRLDTIDFSISVLRDYSCGAVVFDRRHFVILCMHACLHAYLHRTNAIHASTCISTSVISISIVSATVLLQYISVRSNINDITNG